jgi:hypothetical protein
MPVLNESEHAGVIWGTYGLFNNVTKLLFVSALTDICRLQLAFKLCDKSLKIDEDSKICSILIAVSLRMTSYHEFPQC